MLTKGNQRKNYKRATTLNLKMISIMFSEISASISSDILTDSLATKIQKVTSESMKLFSHIKQPIP